MTRALGVVLLGVALCGTAQADPCRLETPEAVAAVRSLIAPGTTIVRHCWYCREPVTEPLRVRELGFERHSSDQVVLALSGETFSVAALEQAEQDRTGPLAEALLARIEREYAEMDLAGSDDPDIEQEKRDRYRMFLRFAREDHEMRVWDELLINGDKADPRLLYVPVGGDNYTAVGAQTGCGMGDAPQRVTYQPIERDPSRERPPTPFVADVTGQCYDGSCPGDEWIVRAETSLYAAADNSEAQLGVLKPGESVAPLQVLSHVRPARGVAVEDHGRFFAGDVFYLLDSQAEGFYRFWHYGDLFVADALDVRIGQDAGCEPERGYWACVEGYPEETWWAEVRRADGRTGWVREPVRSLDGVLIE